jgi:cysteinyl-tRNA synthetase
MPPDFRLYNTLTRKIESFSPEDGKTVRIYACGPTVYKPAHLGNFRTFMFEDLLRRALALRGWKIFQVMNLTDVDDKIIKSASERGISIGEVTEPITKIFHADRAFLRIQDAELYPKATDHIREMISIVERLVEGKLAYLADDGSVYFAIDKFKGYGKLSRLDTREVRSGARVIQDDYSKENAQDFALWKAAKPEDEATGAAWDSPWGRGRPGWHLECSAMAMKYLGETLDIHCGGIDLIFPHHEDEIAQSEGATGKPFSRFWCHGEFLLTDGSKMAKRLGNVATVQDLRDNGVSAAAFRHFVFSTHYRKQLNMSSACLSTPWRFCRETGRSKSRDTGAGENRGGGGRRGDRRLVRRPERSDRARRPVHLRAQGKRGARSPRRRQAGARKGERGFRANKLGARRGAGRGWARSRGGALGRGPFEGAEGSEGPT